MHGYGVQFLVNNYAQIRFEMIYYALLKGAIAKEDFDTLSLIVSSCYHDRMGCDADDVLQLMEGMRGCYRDMG